MVTLRTIPNKWNPSLSALASLFAPIYYYIWELPITLPTQRADKCSDFPLRLTSEQLPDTSTLRVYIIQKQNQLIT